MKKTDSERQQEKEKIISSMVKESYQEHYTKLLGSKQQYEEFLDKALNYPTRAIRVNTIKAKVDDVKKRLKDKGWKLRNVEWCNTAFYIEKEDRRDVGNLEEHALGYIYVQEPSSMIPPLALSPKPDEMVLDVAAAPGSKTTQMAALMQNKGLIVANEKDMRRITSLKANLERMGVSNTVITHLDGRRINLEGFDKILLDAPCSGTGTLSKSLKSLEMWNPKGIEKLARLQGQLLEKAYNMLKPGGVVAYSTCSLEVEENEGVLNTFFRRHEEAGSLKVDASEKQSKPYLEFEGKNMDSRVGKSARLWPHISGSDGFFISLIRKEE